jgi:hypothetical protein
MELSPSDEVTKVVRRWSRNTTLDELRERGVQTVRTVSMSRVGSLIEKAVNRALLERTLGDPSDLGDAFSRSARNAFVKLVQEQGVGGSAEQVVEGSDKLTSGSMHDAAGPALERLKHDLRERRRVLMEEQERLTKEVRQPGPGDQELQISLTRLFKAWGGNPDKLSPLEAEVVRVGVAALQRERQRGQQALLDENRRIVDRLEHRVRKLSRTLEVTREELELALERPSSEVGPSFLPHGVQALSAPEPLNENKRALLSAIFEANVELRAALDA